ncbi:hypothetical protein KM1_105800 [Entamoeba histolytica HM-3:IMSS]|uniref:Uncharacterized protein n=1 Tax=Entamoeba histolytica HM-3:IMSS TaxID=885315 RepID=M7WX68_ENTHI|nr:hypothetical protein KM1_105800 [Entamoeba histolytica HM-3:IMSS]
MEVNDKDEKIRSIEANKEKLKKKIRDKEKQISKYQEIAERTREELDNTQKESKTQK